MSSMLEDLYSMLDSAGRRNLGHIMQVNKDDMDLPEPAPAPKPAARPRRYPDAAHRNSRPIRLKPSTITVDMDPTSKKG
jgi:hypothetical protein